MEKEFHKITLKMKKGKTHSISLAWKIPWTEESGGLQFLGLQSWT